MIKTHKIKLNPTPEQEVYFKKACGTARFAYNWALNRWMEHKSNNPKMSFGPMALKKEFNAIKREKFPWVYEVTKTASEGAFFCLAAALKNYYDSKSGKRDDRVGFPRFKSKKAERQSFYIANDQFRLNDHWIRVPKLGWVNMTEKLRFDGKIMSAVISSYANSWYVAISVELENRKIADFHRQSIGIDLGLKSLATLSDGTVFENQKHMRSELNRLRRLNRRLSRRNHGSGRWCRTRYKLARLHKRIADKRLDVIHKMTTKIAKTYRLIGVEDLNIRGMQGNRRLSLSIADAAWGEILRQLEYKSRWFGGKTFRVDRFFASSRLCSKCGYKNQELTLSDRMWVCCNCGVSHERDWNASKNIEAEMLRLAVVASSTG